MARQRRSDVEQKFAAAVARRIRDVRKAKGMTLRQVADAADMDESQLHRYETGEYMPKLYAIDRLAHALDVPLRVLVPQSYLYVSTKTLAVKSAST